MEHPAILFQLQDSKMNQSKAELAGWKLCSTTWGFCCLISAVQAARAVTIINKVTASVQSSLVSCTLQAGQGKHTASLHFEQGHAQCTSARAWPDQASMSSFPLPCPAHQEPMPLGHQEQPLGLGLGARIAVHRHHGVTPQHSHAFISYLHLPSVRVPVITDASGDC